MRAAPIHADRRADIPKLIGAFCIYENVPKNQYVTWLASLATARLFLLFPSPYGTFVLTYAVYIHNLGLRTYGRVCV